MVKPDGVQRALVGEVISRFEKRGLKLIAVKIYRIPTDIAERFYGEHKGKHFYDSLIRYITSGPVVCMVWEGEEAVSVVRAMMGKTNPAEAAAGTIRGDFALHPGRNVIHGSDSEASAKREINLLFNDYELIDYKRIDAEWLVE
ncbi:MAG: nucleoside-diphosphate kinase [Thermoplasmata archaeon]|uniref:Nucleoside diphosphate kinase n=1 Tax=Candidatus Sysuiplasma superficiale TaxID=2823368 RepID=A0A8J7YMX5_9ARCH|nr:nucleoside-diphosphate kinase [Candidatus Sysuiplasma superficiale]MBX8643970.1 nucleoside-diphosphate kinase [Candidatus Sysuiplasma superficiale]MCL4346897.1 nucleoside-diphosphate kinase [Candidatus Thermoplasmatota archaeon]